MLENPPDGDSYFHPPILVATMPAFQAQNDSAATTMVVGDTVRSSVLSLWHPAVLTRRHIALISDPRQSYTVRLEWDVGAWVAYTVRYHAYAILPCAWSLALLAVVLREKTEEEVVVPSITTPRKEATWVFVCCGGAVAITSATLPVATATLSWLPLSVLENTIIGCVSYTVLTIVRNIVYIIVNVLAIVHKTKERRKNGTTNTSSTVSVPVLRLLLFFASSYVHPALPSLLGLAIALFTASRTVKTYQYITTLSLHAIIVLGPSFLWLYGWMASGMGPTYEYSYPLLCAERMLMLLIAIHSSSFVITPTRHRHHFRTFVLALISIMTACSGLWGYVYVVLYAAGAVSMLDVVMLWMWPGSIATKVPKKNE